jgi:hypothetical protein
MVPLENPRRVASVRSRDIILQSRRACPGSASTAGTRPAARNSLFQQSAKVGLFDLSDHAGCAETVAAHAVTAICESRCAPSPADSRRRFPPRRLRPEQAERSSETRPAQARCRRRRSGHSRDARCRSAACLPAVIWTFKVIFSRRRKNICSISLRVPCGWTLTPSATRSAAAVTCNVRDIVLITLPGTTGMTRLTRVPSDRLPSWEYTKAAIALATITRMNNTINERSVRRRFGDAAAVMCTPRW